MMFNRQHTKHNLTLISNVPRSSAKKFLAGRIIPVLRYSVSSYGLTLKSRFGVIQDHWKLHHAIDCIRVHILTMALSCIIFEI